MIEVTFEFKFDSFLVNSVGGSGELAGTAPNKALRFVCERISSVKQLTENAPTAEFEFLGSARQSATTADRAKEFDDKLSEYLTSHTTVDISSVTVSSEASGYSTMPKGVSTGEIGRMMLTTLPNQSRVDITLVLKNDEFDAAWKLTAEQEIQQVMARLVCFELTQGNPAASSQGILTAGIVSSSLRFIPRSGG
jgi:hypothetical protein